MKRVEIVLCLFATLIGISDGAYLGGTISWRVLNNQVRFVYRLTWENGTGPCGSPCTMANLNSTGSLPIGLQSMGWKCSSGCSNNSVIHDVNYGVTAVSKLVPGWEQGENYFFTNLNGNGPFVVELSDIPWKVTSTSPGSMITSIDLRIRNDSGLPNASPVAALQPIVGLQFGCKSTLRLPVDDPDGDVLRCRMARSSDECAGACTNLPLAGLYIDEMKCTLELDATTANGYTPGKDYRLTIMVEDMPAYPTYFGNEEITKHKSFSAIPLQMTISIIQSTSPCMVLDVEFVTPEVPDEIRYPYPGPPAEWHLVTYIGGENISDIEYMVSTTKTSTYAILSDDYPPRSNVTRIYSNWTPLQEQAADSVHCVWGRQPDGITTDKRCVTGIAFDIDHCNPTPCKRNGTCITLYQRFTCRCPEGYIPPDCTDRAIVKAKPLLPTKKKKIWPVAVGVTIGVVALASLLCCCWWWVLGGASRCREDDEKKNRTKNRVSTEDSKQCRSSITSTFPGKFGSTVSVKSNGAFDEPTHQSNIQNDGIPAKSPDIS